MPIKHKILKTLRSFSSLKVTAFFLVAFMLLLFWGVLGMASVGENSNLVANRFFFSYFIWILGIIPIPGLKLLSILAGIHLILNMVFRMPRGIKNIGLWGMHVALLILLFGGVFSSELKREYSGYGLSNNVQVASDTPQGIQDVIFFDEDGNKIPFDSFSKNFVGELDKHLLKNDYQPFTFDEGFYTLTFKGFVDMTAEKKVVLLSAIYDPLHFVPYLFSVLFLLSIATHYVIRKALKVKPAKKISPLLLLPLALTFVTNSHAQTPDSQITPTQPILWNGEVRVLDSYARSFLDNLSGRVQYTCTPNDIHDCHGKLTAFDVFENIISNPESTSKWNLFKIMKNDVSRFLDLPDSQRYVSYDQLQAAREKIQFYASRDDNHPVTLEMKRIFSNIMEYESIEEINKKTQNNFTPFKFLQENSPEFLEMSTSARLKLEYFYHRSNFCLWAFVFAFIGFILSSFNVILKSRKIDFYANGSCIAAAIILFVIFILRFYIAARPPFSSLYEIILLVVLMLEIFLGAAFVRCKNRQYSMMAPIAFVASALLFFAKFILETGNTFQAIPALLNASAFLTTHVFTIALGYAGMILSGIIAHVVLLRALWASRSGKDYLSSEESKHVKRLLDGSLIFGFAFTVVGTLLGGVWADFAWGRFWGFDPKECGALFIILWAMLAVHLRACGLLKSFGFIIFNSMNVIVTFLCWFGINLLGVGLHSYGFQNGTALWLLTFTLADAIFIFLASKKIRLKITGKV